MAAKKIGGITIPSNIGYSGSGWNYPSAAVGNQVVRYSTTPGVAPVIAATGTPITQAIADTGGGDTGGGGGSTASSDAYLTDPGYLAALAAQQAQSQQLDAGLRAAQERAIVGFGDPGLAASLGITIDPLTAAAAQQNTQAGTSTLAQLQRTRDLSQQGIVNNLAAHGLQFSGDVGYKTGQNQQTYGINLYNAQNNVLTGLANLAQQTASAKAGLSGDVVTALTNAYNNFVANPGLYGQALDTTGGSNAAANQVATTPAVTPTSTPAPTAPKKPAVTVVSRLAQNPFAYRTARNVAMG